MNSLLPLITCQLYKSLHLPSNRNYGDNRMREKKKHVKEATILDVASLARVSPTTVSNMLNGRFDRMGQDTVERIQQAIEQLGYTPSQVARQLKTGHAPIIGLI